MSGGRRGSDSLARRFEEGWVSRGWSRPGDRLVVACSGGVDSLTLLHLLRFSAPAIPGRIEVAHFDHRLRPDSAEEALWLQGVSEAWGIPFHLGSAEQVARNEEGARELRYRFLEGLLAEGARWVLTAHHQDDQVETILFRILRGTGLEGVRGMREEREPGILRPLLPFSRREIDEYAREHRLRPLLDPSNDSHRHARNRIRHDLLPALEKVHPGAREGLLRLARHADSATRTLNLLLSPLREGLLLDSSPDRLHLDRSLYLALDEPIQVELLRSLMTSIGARISETGTATALEFMRTGTSGTGIDLEDAIRVSRDFDRLSLSRVGQRGGEVQNRRSNPLRILDPGEGVGEISLSGRRFLVHWGPIPEGIGEGAKVRAGSGAGLLHFEASKAELNFPVTIRGWVEGDRIRMAGGVRKVKKLFGELRVPVSDRARALLLVDGSGEVLWVAGLQRGTVARRPATGAEGWEVSVQVLDDDGAP